LDNFFKVIVPGRPRHIRYYTSFYFKLCDDNK